MSRRHTTAPIPGTSLKRLLLAMTGLAGIVSGTAALAQSDERWYQIEVTVFSQEYAFQEREIWPMDMLEQPVARTTRPLDSMMDILDLPDWNILYPASVSLEPGLYASDLDPGPIGLHSSDFRLPDAERDALLALPASAHEFTDTNRALTTSASYRVLYHSAWRQPVRGTNQSVPIWISGGNAFGDRHELEGSLTIRFNPGQDRVVLDARLWLTQFSAQPAALGAEIRLPDLPQSVTDKLMARADTTANTVTSTMPSREWHPVQVIPVLSSREMRSNEFHYLDHPAVGIVVHVSPYTVPPAITPTAPFLESFSDPQSNPMAEPSATPSAEAPQTLPPPVF